MSKFEVVNWKNKETIVLSCNTSYEKQLLINTLENMHSESLEYVEECNCTQCVVEKRILTDKGLLWF